MSTPVGSPEVAGSNLPGSGRRLAIEAALIAALALTLNLAGNGRVSLWDRDEPRYAACVREMRARHDWIYPTFNAEPRFHKPILIYWLMRAGYGVAGDNPFGARLISSLSGVGACLLVWGLGRRMLGPQAGRWSALILATSPIMVVESKLAITDAFLNLCLVGCQFCLWELAKRPSRWLATGFWAGLSLATLTKGPVGPAIIGLAGLVSWWWSGPTACWKRLHWRWGVAGFVALTAPWYVAIGWISHGDFFRVSMGYHVIERMTTGIEQHGGFPGYYIVLSLVTFFPWSALVPAAIVGAWSRRKTSPVFGFLLGWVIGPLILFEAVQTKLIHYFLPAYPGCALLAGWLVTAVAADVATFRRWPLGRLGLGLLGGIGIGGTVALIAAGVVLPGVWGVPSLRWPLLVLAVVMGAGTLFALERLHQGQTERAVVGLIVAWALVLGGTGAWLLPAYEPLKISRIVGERLAELSASTRATPVLGEFQEPAVIYALGRPAQVMSRRADYINLARSQGPLIAPLVQGELDILGREPSLDLKVVGSAHGLNHDKGKLVTLWFTRIESRNSIMATRQSQALDVK